MKDQLELVAAAGLLTGAAAILEHSTSLAFASAAVAFVIIGVWVERS